MMNILNYRDAKEVKDPIYDVEVEIEGLGWIPYSSNQSSVNPNTPHEVEIAQWLIDNPSEITMKSPAEILEMNKEQATEQKKSELRANFEAESKADVTSEGEVWEGGLAKAAEFNNKAALKDHGNKPDGTLHSKDHKPHTFNLNKIKNVAEAINDSYEAAELNHEAKLAAIEACGDDVACINAITW